jgi:hypothetical protein
MINTFMLARDYDLVTSFDEWPRSAGQRPTSRHHTLGQYV